MLQALERESKSKSRFTAANSKRSAIQTRERRGAALQAAYGNQAVLRVSRPAGAERPQGKCSCGGSCKSCQARATEENEVAARDALRRPRGSDNEETDDSVPHAGDAGTVDAGTADAGRGDAGTVPADAGATPASCCDQAIAAGLMRTDYGAVICCNNVKHSCVDPSNFSAALTNATARRISTTCALVHEDTHHDDIDCSGAALERPGWRAGKDARAEECVAYTAEANCLTNHLGDCGADAECTRQLTDRRDTKRRQGTCA